MTTIDGYFSQRPIPNNVVIIPDEGEEEELEPSNSGDPTQSSSSSSQKGQRRRLSLSEEASEGYQSDPESLPPQYESRRPSGTFERPAAFLPGGVGSSTLRVPSNMPVNHQNNEQQPLLQSQPLQPVQHEQRHETCNCGHPQCISCSIAGWTVGQHYNSNNNNNNDGRGFRFKPKRSRFRRAFRLICSTLFALLVLWMFLASWRLREIYKEIAPIGDDAPYPDERYGMCRDAETKYHVDLEFSVPVDASKSFTFEQLVEERSIDLMSTRRQVHVGGQVSVKSAAEESSKSEIVVIINLSMTDKALQDQVQVVSRNGLVFIKSPRTLPEDGRPACLMVDATVILPRLRYEPRVSEFNILTETVAINIDESARLETLKAQFKTIAAHIASNTDPRKNNNAVNAADLSVRSISGAVKGNWGVGDKASWNTKSGSIKIGLFPTDRKAPKSPDVSLDIQSISGSIAVSSLDNKYLFQRHVKSYSTRLSTSSGSITGQYVLGSSLTINSISGRLDMDIVPFAPSSDSRERPISFLKSETKSSRTQLHFLNPQTGKTTTRPPPLPGKNPFKWILGEHLRLVEYLKKKCHKHNDGNASGNSKEEDVTAAVLIQNAGVYSAPTIVASHHTVSGAIVLHYPSSFEGVISAKSLSSSILVEGEGVEIIRKKKQWPVGNEVEAIKGNATAGGRVECETVSGGISIMLP